MADRTRTPARKVSIPTLALRPNDAARSLGIGERKLWKITADQTSGIPRERLIAWRREMTRRRWQTA